MNDSGLNKKTIFLSSFLFFLPDSDVPRGRAGQLILPVTIFSILRSWCQVTGSDRENRGKEKIILTNEKEKKWRKRG